MGPSSEAEIVPRVRGGSEWAARWASLSPFLSFRLEGGRGPSWARLSLTCVCVFQSDLSTPIRVSLIVVPDNRVDARMIFYILLLIDMIEDGKFTGY